ncbi:MAG: tetratricopeptide repeat protein [Euryarchaeota archaeon]|nr:tetratricopeptide repeat protein [Euryarchaeota archaeon]
MARLRALREDILAFLATRPVSGDAADGISRDDLAKRLGYRPTSVWGVLKELVALGDVVSVRAHVPGAPYRRQVFRLTDEALRRVSADVIPVPKGLPELAEPFVGRAKELEQLHRLYKNGGLCVVDGVPGVGKTALVRCSLRFVWGSRLLIWMTLRGISPAGLEARIATEVRALRRSGKNEASPSLPGPPASGRISDLVRSSPVGIVMVLDELQDAPPETLLALKEALAAFAPGSMHSAVLITQREPPFSLPTGVSHLVLRGLSRREALALTDALGLPEERFEELYRGTLGSPRFLRQGIGAPHGGEELFADTVLASITAEQRRSLLPLAFVWVRASPSLALSAGLAAKDVQDLVSRSILDNTESGLRVPEPLAQRLRETAGGEERRGAHRFLANLKDGPMGPAERFVHLIEAEEVGRASRWLEKERMAITEEGPARVLQPVLRLAHLLERGEARGQALATAAELVRRGGDFVAAASCLERALEDLPAASYPALLSACLLVQSDLRAGHREEAEAWASRISSGRIGRETRPAVELIEGTLLAYRGKVEAALPHFERAARLASGTGQKELQRLALHGLAFVHGALGHFDTVLESYREGSALARELGSRFLDLHFELDAAQALLALERLDEAEERYRRMLQECRGLGSRNCAAVALLGLASVAWKRSRHPQALSYAEEALIQAETAADRSLVGRTLANLSEILRTGGDRTRAVKTAQRAVRLAREGGREADIRFALDALRAARGRTDQRPPGGPTGKSTHAQEKT